MRTAFSSQSLHLICLQEEVDKKIGDLDIMSEIKKPDIYKMNLPADLKKLSTAQCEELCGDIRKILIDTVSKTAVILRQILVLWSLQWLSTEF